jgi:hypothetical protein
VVYGPHRDQEKRLFLSELQQVRSTHLGPWLVCGDFNLIYRAADKSNSRLYRNALNLMELTELHLQGRLFTWSNEQHHPTLSKIDRSFACMGWCDLHPNHALHALSTCASYHAPLLLHTDLVAPSKQRFHFESIWPRFPGYLEAIADDWRGASSHADSFRSLGIKLRNMAKALKRWSQKFIESVRFQLVVAKEVIFKLEQAQDTHPIILGFLQPIPGQSILHNPASEACGN